MDITIHKQAEANLQQTNAKLERWIEELKQRNQDMELLAEMNEFLQSCVTLEEANCAIAW